MRFEYIILTRKEYRRLKELARHPAGLPTGQNETALMNNHLITRNRYGSSAPDADCPSTTMSVITQQGLNYLLYRKKHRNDWWWNKGLQILNLILALIAAATGIIALLSQ